MCTAICVAGGSGERFGEPGGKQLAPVLGVPVVTRALLALAAADTVGSIVLVCHPDRVEEYRARALGWPGLEKVSSVVAGGDTRGASVRAGLAELGAGEGIVVVHDGARPLVEPATVDAAVAALRERPDVDGVVVGHPVCDTMKQVDATASVVFTPDRRALWAAQTPQVFRAPFLREAYAAAAEEGFEGTDDASVVERAGGRVVMLEGSRWNVKVTFGEDLAVVEALLREREGSDA